MKNLNRRLFLKTAGMLAGSSVISKTGGQFQTPEPLNEKSDKYYVSTEYHVAISGNDYNPGTQAAPLRTIQRAADLARPGNIITVHEGLYRERVNPPRGGESDTKRIVYQAAPGEKVEIKGSEVIKNWVKYQDDVWKVVLPNLYFGSINPYSELISGGWFNSRGRDHHTGAVYLNGEWFDEADGLDKVLEPVGVNPLWFAHVDRHYTTIFAQFKRMNPNEQMVEINVRWTVFYPEVPGINYITVRGFTLLHAATQWAPPRAEQVGLIGTHWSKGWIIENNVISHSRCAGITLGKYGDEWDNNKKEGIFIEYMKRAHTKSWNKETIGSHIVRNNTISNCEQAGIVGSLGAVFSKITNNEIHDIHVRRLFSGAEIAGIKLHVPIDVEISRNHIYRTGGFGLWMDGMAQGTRITCNLCHNNIDDLFMEIGHGPYIVDNNLFLSDSNVIDYSQGGAYIHNLMTGYISSKPDKRITPYLLSHSTAIAGVSEISGSDNRFYNNIFVGGKGPSLEKDKNPKHTKEYGLCGYDKRELPLQTRGNVYLNGANPYSKELNPLLLTDEESDLKVVEEGTQVFIYSDNSADLKKADTKIVTTKLLGLAMIPKVPYENPDGSSLTLDTDYFGNQRNKTKPTAGPFENPGTGQITLKVW